MSATYKYILNALFVADVTHVKSNDDAHLKDITIFPVSIWCHLVDTILTSYDCDCKLLEFGHNTTIWDLTRTC